jgi:hypothetical protein
MKFKEIPFDIGNYLYYAEDSPSSLRWSCDIGRKIKKDTVAGSLHKSRYWRLRFRSYTYNLHRIVWFIHKGSLDQSTIVDHIDNNQGNNKISNLRLANVSQNMYNMGVSLYNKSGVKGICYQRSAHGNEYWRANLKYTDSFGIRQKILKLFTFNDEGLKLATEWIKVQRALHHLSFSRDA